MLLIECERRKWWWEVWEREVSFINARCGGCVASATTTEFAGDFQALPYVSMPSRTHLSRHNPSLFVWLWYLVSSVYCLQLPATSRRQLPHLTHFVELFPHFFLFVHHRGVVCKWRFEVVRASMLSESYSGAGLLCSRAVNKNSCWGWTHNDESRSGKLWKRVLPTQQEWF